MDESSSGKQTGTFVYLCSHQHFHLHRALQLQEAVFGKLLEREVAFYDRTGVGEIGSYLSQVNYLCGHV